MDRRMWFPFVLGLLIAGVPLGAYSYSLNRQVSALETELGVRDQQLAMLQEQIDSLNETVIGLHGEVTILQEEIDALRRAWGLINETMQGPFMLMIILEKSSFEVGEPVKMTARIVNVGEISVTIVFSIFNEPAWFDWIVYNESGLVFYHTYKVMLPAFKEVTLLPGEYIQQNYTWNQKTTNEQQVSPGDYYIRMETGFLYENNGIILETQIKFSIRS